MKAKDLVTKEEDIVKGVMWQSHQKRSLSKDIVKNSLEAKRRLRKITDIEDIFCDNLLLDFVLAATMLSKKSIQHFSHSSLVSYIKSEIDFDRINEQNYLNEIEKYYLQTAGEAVGGKIRNIIGKKGNDIFVRYIKEYLNKNNIEYIEIIKNNNIQLIETNEIVILFNKKPNFIGKSVDFLVIKKYENGTYDIEDHNQYISAGELKSGIDPAGADEHWKTARTALSRIHKAFIQKNIDSPNIFFIGGAISKNMAEEIIENIYNKKLAWGANLNNKKQMEKTIKELLNL
jgi:type II restriction enzyme